MAGLWDLGDRVLIGIVIVAHGGLAREYLSAVEHVVGHQDSMVAIPIEGEPDREAFSGDIGEVHGSCTFPDPAFLAQKGGYTSHGGDLR